MGIAKRELDERKEKDQSAIDLCKKIGAIEECDLHDGEYIDTCAYSDADELTSIILEDNPDALKYFDSRTEMVEYISDTMQMAGDECGHCAYIRDHG